MPLNNIERVRSLIGDMDKSAVRELVDEGPAVGLLYQLDAFPVRTGSVTVFVSGTVRGSATASPAQLALGIIDFTGVATAVTAGAEVRVTYRYNALSEDEIQSTIDAVSGTVGDHVILAASLAARGLAANYARFYSYTQGDKSVNKDKISEKLILVAESLEKAYENTVKMGSMNITMATNDSSGTFFEGYDTGIAAGIINTGFNPRI